MSESVVPLALESLPLTGHHLIEASAGTGKTFTLAAVYLRLVLGPLPGREKVDFPRPLTPPEILVVTFTEAATAELRGRIRARLKQAREWLLAEASARDDRVLGLLLAPLVESGDTACRQAARRLDQAARLMDEAAIFTIHGFCQRMLTRHAFDAGARFSAELMQDGRALLTRAVEDYWRREFYPLETRWQREIQRRWSGPEALVGELRTLLKDGVAQPLWVGEHVVEAPASLETLLTSVDAALQARSDAQASLTATWNRETISAVMMQAFEAEALNRNSYKHEELQDRLDAFELWLAQGAVDADDAVTDTSGRFWLAADKLAGATKKGKEVPVHAFFDALAAVSTQGQPFDAIAQQVLVHARDQVAATYREEKRHLGVWEFADLLNDLDAALTLSTRQDDSASQHQRDNASQSTPALRLAARIRHELPVALIDEFQDTDPVQYRIFSRLYRAPEVDPTASSLLMIGDPKQAIYAFRGADIHTYLRARRETPSRFTLMRNFRSTPAMVAATNALFAQCDEPFGSPEIPFVAVQAQTKSARLVDRQGHEIAALGAWWPETSLYSQGRYQSLMASTTRAEVQRMLEGEWRFENTALESATSESAAFDSTQSDDTQSGSTQSGSTQSNSPVETHPVAPADIAILVRNGSEALKVRRALSDGGIRSVYLSERSSVFDTPQAFEMLQLFEAVAQPRDDRRLKAALASRLLSDGPQVLELLLADELAWEREVERFSDYQRQWQRRGVLPMLRSVMRDFAVAERLASGAGGERALTDLLHLGELAQNAQQRLDGEQALLRWWHGALEGGDETLDGETLDGETLSQRLESDEDLVRVVTVHKSKGLEYPIVLLPFACSFRPAQPDGAGLLALRPASIEGSVMVASADDAQKQEAERARLDEDVRLLYVALTRAAFACRLGVAQVSRGNKKSSCVHETALGRLLGSEPKEDGAALLARLAKAELAVIEPALMPTTPLRRHAQTPHWKPARTFHGRVDDDWWIASYTALIADARHVTALGGRAQNASNTQDLPAALDIEVSRERDPVPRPRIRTLLDFPRGPRPGTFLHALLESLDFDRLGDPSQRESLRRDIERRLALAGYEAEWTPLLEGWLLERLRQPLLVHEGHSVTLDRLEAWRPELEFWLPAKSAWSDLLDRLVTAAEPLPKRRPQLSQRKLNGMLKGYIDLVFQAHGRWYVLDWKSNHLGDDPDDYRQAALEAAMVEHRYDLQYVLYVLALHRLLKSRLENYDYDVHMGGACYVFLRGLPTPDEGSPDDTLRGVFWRRPERVLIEALDVWLDGDASPARALLAASRSGDMAPEIESGVALGAISESGSADDDR